MCGYLLLPPTPSISWYRGTVSVSQASLVSHKLHSLLEGLCLQRGPGQARLSQTRSQPPPQQEGSNDFPSY